MKRLVDDVSLLANVHMFKRNPVSLVHFVTNRCNARCSFCFIDFDDPETFRHELNLEEIATLTKNLGPNLQNVNLTGGEPFARKDFNEIVQLYFENTSIRSVFITTNGSLPDRIESLCELVSENYPDHMVFFQISIDQLEEKHDEIRKINGLFKNAVKSYKICKSFGKNIDSSIAITVSDENHSSVVDVYEHLKKYHAITHVTPNIVRDEGVYKIPKKQKSAILQAYVALSDRIRQDQKNKTMQGWDSTTLQGRLMNEKNKIWRKTIEEIYLQPKFILPCMAGSIFGIIEADGKVKPCEILDKTLGNLRDYDMNLEFLWSSTRAKEVKNWIKSTKCNCHYDCAWSFNILAGKRYQPRLLSAAFGLTKG